MRAAGQRPGHERREGDEHAGTAAADGVERSRGAAAAELHADAEQERARHHRHPHRRDEAAHRRAEQGARRQGREEQRAGDRQHRHLRAQPGAATVGEEHPPRRGEAERRVVERRPQRAADEIERRLPRAERRVEIPRAQRQQRQRHAERQRIASQPPPNRRPRRDGGRCGNHAHENLPERMRSPEIGFYTKIVNIKLFNILYWLFSSGTRPRRGNLGAIPSRNRDIVSNDDFPPIHGVVL
ncbi:hypothetical protein KL86APRO_20572 [uncultured Alphaproteobacteria bacterium]|uniref:Uncharacterized protein n=1 Tax=uncultured Alphaproteobacteria bacterium TaxID=91750 RepID=A0A212KL35_9PROT|nr:hypothetical protein KL86APRO_20572 [uncultured Alphaproteobacteria bacterium]